MIRVLLAAVALAAGAWLVVQERAARAEQELTRLAFEAREAPPAAESDALLRRARLLNPDRRPDLFEGVVRARQNRTDEAIAAIQRVTRGEPENLEAWGLAGAGRRGRRPRFGPGGSGSGGGSWLRPCGSAGELRQVREVAGRS